MDIKVQCIEEFYKLIEDNNLLKIKIKNYSLQALLEELLDLLEKGIIRCVEYKNNEWKLNSYIKKAIILYFKVNKISEFKIGPLKFMDKIPLRTSGFFENTRIVPPFSAVRRGAYLGKACVLMPPAYVNIGSYIDDETMLEGLAGSCSQIGKRCHISAGAVVGGVLDPVGLIPVIIEDDVLLSENSGITEGARIGKLGVLAPGVHVSKGTVIFDDIFKKAYANDGTYSVIEKKLTTDVKILLKDKLLESKDESYGPVIPAGALVINGITASKTGFLKVTPYITKYIKNINERSFSLEEALR